MPFKAARRTVLRVHLLDVLDGAAEAAAVPFKAAQRTMLRVHLLDVLDRASEAAEATAVPLKVAAHSATRPSPGRGGGGGGGRARAPRSSVARGAAVQILDGAAEATEVACPQGGVANGAAPPYSGQGGDGGGGLGRARRDDASCSAPVHLLDAGAYNNIIIG